MTATIAKAKEESKERKIEILREIASRKAVLDDPNVSELVKRAMLRFWRKLDEVECDCGAETEGKWADIHEAGCRVFQAKSMQPNGQEPRQ